jgi:hypothetical protein
MKFSRFAAAMLAPAALGAAIVAGALTGAAQPAAAQVRVPAAVQRSASTPVLVNCEGAHVVRPSQFVIACADGGIRLSHLSWQTWGSTAYGGGTFVENDCVPNCAEGTYYYFPVLTVLWRPQALPSGGGQYFTRLTEIFTGKHCMPGYNGSTYCIPTPGTTDLWAPAR